MTRSWKPLVLAAPAAVLAAGLVLAQAPALAGQGRYKKMPNGDCVWDGRDSGPDQCKPANYKPKGRYKLDGTRCYWEPNDEGPNQCEPPKR